MASTYQFHSRTPLEEPTASPCFERVKFLFRSENVDSDCARKAIQQMLSTAARSGIFTHTN